MIQVYCRSKKKLYLLSITSFDNLGKMAMPTYVGKCLKETVDREVELWFGQ